MSSSVTTAPFEAVEDLIDRLPPLAACRESVVAAITSICTCYRNGGKLLLCGNGCSALDSDDIFGELMKGFQLPQEIPSPDLARLTKAFGVTGTELGQRLQRGVAAVSLGGQSALLTAVANDTDPSLIYAQQVYALGRPGDILIGI